MRGWELLALAAAALFFKQVLLVLVQLVGRLKDRSFRHPEDAKMLNASVGDSPLTKRGQDVIDNSLENELIFLILLFGFLSTHKDGEFEPFRSSVRVITTYVQVFVGARYAHALFMLTRVAGLRSVAYAVGLLASIGLAVRIVMDIF